MDESFLESAERDALNRLEEARKKVQARPRPSGFDGSCTECGEAVDEARVGLGYYSCVSCQHALEKRQRFYR